MTALYKTDDGYAYLAHAREDEIIELKKQGHNMFILSEACGRIYKHVSEPIIIKNGLGKQFHGFSIIKNRKQKYIDFIFWLLLLFYSY